MKIKSLFLMLALGALSASNTASASSCLLTDVTLDGNNATSCGWSSDQNDVTPGNIADWSVNLDNNIDSDGNFISGAGGINYWAYYEKEEDGNNNDGNTTDIGLIVDGDIAGEFTAGTFSLNAFDPILITLQGGSENYHWYLFEGITGTVNGAFDASVLEGNNTLSSLSAYTTATVVPVPATVWLFGSGLLGLVGVARRRSA